jgi:NAD(P)-dependent dehydrogenase (short-subunit alcohol dehydrogenase family)/acyl carrier protein
VAAVPSTAVAAVVAVPAVLSQPEPAPVVTAAPVSAVAVEVVGIDRAELSAALIGIVASITGYPADMLDDSMDIEADLGIDSIKRVEILGNLRDAFPQAPVLGPQHLGDISTLADIVTLLSGTPQTATADAGNVQTGNTEASNTEANNAESSESTDEVAQSQVEHGIGRHHVALRQLPAADYLSWPGEHRVAVVIDDGSRGRAVTFGLQQDGFSVYLLSLPGAEPVPGAQSLTDWSEEALAGPIAEILAAEDGIDACLYLATAPALTWEDAQQRLVTGLLAAKITQPALEQAAARHGRAAFVTVTAIDGALGHRGSASEPVAILGGLTGLTKTLAVEAPTIRCRSIDLDPVLDAGETAEAIVAELHDPSIGTVEVGVDRTGRWGWELVPFTGSDHTAALDRNDTVLVTGGARGVTAACAVELARQFQPKLILLGRTPLGEQPAWANGVNGVAELRSAAVADLRARGAQPKPRDIEKAVAAVLAEREVRATMAAAQAAGARVDYVAADVTDSAATSKALQPYLQSITAVVHGAGLLADQVVAKKSASDAARVLAAKLTGLRNVLDVVNGSKLKRLVLFSSVAGLFGNYGQSDYAMANEALNKLARCGSRPAGITSINWGAWDGGMVSPELAAMFNERGITLVPVPVGAGMLAEEFTTGRQADQVVMFGPVAALSEPAVGLPSTELRLRRTLAGLGSSAALQSHQLGGSPVLPLTYALGLALNAVEQVTGSAAVSAEDVRLLNGVVFDASVPEALQVVLSSTDPDTVRVRIEDADGGHRPRYSVAAISVAEQAGTATPGSALDPATPVQDLSVYTDGTLFHGPALRGVRGQLPSSDGTLQLLCQLAGTAEGEASWSAARYSADLTDLALQACLVWLRQEAGQPSLPTAIGEVTLLRRVASDSAFRLAVTGRVTTSGASCDVSAYAGDGSLLAQLRNVVLVVSPNLAAAFGSVPVPSARTAVAAGVPVA